MKSGKNNEVDSTSILGVKIPGGSKIPGHFGEVVGAC